MLLQVATADVVCSEYTDLYVLTKEDLLEVASAYEGTLDLLAANRSSSLRCQWNECKPWRSYDLAYPSRVITTGAADAAAGTAVESPAPTAAGPVPGLRPAGWTEEDQFVCELEEAQQQRRRLARAPPPHDRPTPPSSFTSRPSVVTWFAGSLQQARPTAVAAAAATADYPREWYGRNELAKTVQVPPQPPPPSPPLPPTSGQVSSPDLRPRPSSVLSTPPLLHPELSLSKLPLLPPVLSLYAQCRGPVTTYPPASHHASLSVPRHF